MNIPPSFEGAYRREQKVGDRIRLLAGERLRLLCSDMHWLFDDRVKSEESALAKMQIGLFRDLSSMRDLYAATIVVGTRTEIEQAVHAVRSVYPGAEASARRKADPGMFAYDDVHVAAALRSTAPGEPRDIRERKFEIQVRTGLQYSWWRATHDKIYKGATKSWAVQRVAGQVRGTLELVDGVLADLDTSAELLDRPTTDLETDAELITDWLTLWPAPSRPNDPQGFVEAVSDLLTAGGVSTAGGMQLLGSNRGRMLIANDTLTPVQALTILIAELRGVSALLRRGRLPDGRNRKPWLLITDEMEAASPILVRIPADRRARLS